MPRAIDAAHTDGLRFIAVRGKALSPGYYLARRKTWGPDFGWSLVYVYVQDDSGRTKIGVFQAGSEEPESPRQWVFRSRLMGLDHLPASLPPHPRVQLAEIVH